MESLDEQIARLQRQIDAGEYEGARWPLQKLLKRHPQHAKLHLAAATIEFRGGSKQAAIGMLQQAIRRFPNDAELREMLGLMFEAVGNPADAEIAFRAATELDANRVGSLEHLVTSSLNRKSYDETEVLLNRLLTITPKNNPALNWLGWLNISTGRIDEAYAAFDRANAIASTEVVQSSICILSNYDPRKSSAEVLALHRQWDAKFGSHAVRPHANERSPDRPLRVGYVSPDFRAHPVNHFFEPLLSHHDANNVQSFCYSNWPAADAATARLRARANHWRDIFGQPDERVEELIRSDKIDILVDLTGHFAENRLTLFARKPAPVQVSMIGYPCTTGLSAIDYKISDPLSDPPEAQAFYSEKLHRLASCLWCFQPAEDSPPVTDLPARRNRSIRFGSVNGFVKITDETLNAWARVVSAVPDSVIHIQTAAFNSARCRQRVIDAFARHEVHASRITLVGLSDYRQFVETIRTFDIALDTFPFNGGTTTCHLLLHGVPMVSQAGDRQVSRMGASMLHAVGWPELVADSVEQRVRKTIDLALDIDRLATIRASLRSRMLDGPLCNARSYAAEIEAAYRTMWNKWCTQAG